MLEMIKKLEKKVLILIFAILASSVLFFQLLIVFTGRWYEILSLGVNVVLVVGLWLIYANEYAKAEKKNFIGHNLVKIWSLCKVILQGVVIFELLIGGICLIITGSDYDEAGLIICGIVAILFGIALRVLSLLVYLKVFNFAGNAFDKIQKGEKILIDKQIKYCLLILAGINVVKLLGTIIGGIIISSSDAGYFSIFSYFTGSSSGFSNTVFRWIQNGYDTGSIVLVFFAIALSTLMAIGTYLIALSITPGKEEE